MTAAEITQWTWECGTHANSWRGHDARCRRVLIRPETSPAPEQGDRAEITLTLEECEQLEDVWIDAERSSDLRAAVERIVADRLAAAVARAEAAEAKVAAVEALVKNWARLAGQACDPDTREWLTATVTSLHAALGSATTDEAGRG